MRWGTALAALLPVDGLHPARRPAAAPPRRSRRHARSRPRSRFASPDTLQCHVDLARERVGFRVLPDRRFGGGCSALGAVQLLDIGTPVTNLGAMTCPLARQFARWAARRCSPRPSQWLGTPVRADRDLRHLCLPAASTASPARGSASMASPTRSTSRPSCSPTAGGSPSSEGWNGDGRAGAPLPARGPPGRLPPLQHRPRPDADAYHHNHLHFDMGRGPYCR